MILDWDIGEQSSAADTFGRVTKMRPMLFGKTFKSVQCFSASRSKIFSGAHLLDKCYHYRGPTILDASILRMCRPHKFFSRLDGKPFDK